MRLAVAFLRNFPRRAEDALLGIDRRLNAAQNPTRFRLAFKLVVRVLLTDEPVRRDTAGRRLHIDRDSRGRLAELYRLQGDLAIEVGDLLGQVLELGFLFARQSTFG